MNITYDAGKKVFLLNAEHSSYAMGITALGFLKHLHWGAQARRIEDFFLKPLSEVEKTIVGIDNAHEPGLEIKKIEKETLFQRMDEEFVGWGGYFYGDPGLKATFGDGNRDVFLLYHSHEIKENEHSCELRIRMKDNVYDLYVDLFYKIYAGLDIIDRWVAVTNSTGQTVTLESAMSAMWHFPRGDAYRFSSMFGKWSGEYRIAQSMLNQSSITVETKTGISGHHSCPWFAVDWRGEATEEEGALYAGTLHWSGNWRITAQLDNLERVRVTGGIHDFDFAWPLAPGEEFATPVFTGVYTKQGFGGASRQFHNYMRAHVLPPLCLEKPPRIMYSSWNLYNFHIDHTQEMEIAGHAAEMGYELIHIDDGWFSTRDNDYQGLGDWEVSDKKFPGGLKPLIEYVKSKGMEFGLWVEPEMVNADTKLFKEHPDWVIHFPGKQKTTGRNQYVLNFAMKEVQDWAIGWITELLENHDIDFFKWDMNRYISEPGWAGEAVEKQKTIWVRFVYGVYRVFAAIKERFPGVYVQNCASGGGRVDMGLMRYCDTVTLTDCGNRWDRVKILWGYTQAFMPFTAGSSWRGRMWGEPALASLAMAGMRVDPRECDAETKATIRKVSENYIKIRHIIHKGDLYRLASPYKDEYVAYEFVLPDKSEALVHVTGLKSTYQRYLPMLKLRGLEPCAVYEMNGHPPMSGEGLMAIGLDVTFESELDSYLIHLRKQP
ncbi:MAG: alpha-galactosidase [Oscillospiraceae bacterium]|nr:alpha-galactosidase [Oscillospiraceae bacterium]